MKLMFKLFVGFLRDLRALPGEMRRRRWQRAHQRGVSYAEEVLRTTPNRDLALETLSSQAELGLHFDRGNGFDHGILAVVEADR